MSASRKSKFDEKKGSTSSNFSSRYVFRLNPDDVICGKKTNFYMNEGDRRLLNIAGRYRSLYRYDAAKHMVEEEIMGEIHGAGGEFLVPVESIHELKNLNLGTPACFDRNNVWKIAPKSMVYDKIKHTITQYGNIVKSTTEKFKRIQEGEDFLQLNSNDVVCGSFYKEMFPHTGNVQFREIVRRYQDQYLSAHTTLEKQNIVKDIKDEIFNKAGGRFLVPSEFGDREKTLGVDGIEDPSSIRLWKVASDKIILKTIKDVLNDRQAKSAITKRKILQDSKKMMKEVEYKRKESKLSESTYLSEVSSTLPLASEKRRFEVIAGPRKTKRQKLGINKGFHPTGDSQPHRKVSLSSSSSPAEKDSINGKEMYRPVPLSRLIQNEENITKIEQHIQNEEEYQTDLRAQICKLTTDLARSTIRTKSLIEKLARMREITGTTTDVPKSDTPAAVVITRETQDVTVLKSQQKNEKDATTSTCFVPGVLASQSNQYTSQWQTGQVTGTVPNNDTITLPAASINETKDVITVPKIQPKNNNNVVANSGKLASLTKKSSTSQRRMRQVTGTVPNKTITLPGNGVNENQDGTFPKSKQNNNDAETDSSCSLFVSNKLASLPKNQSSSQLQNDTTTNNNNNCSCSKAVNAGDHQHHTNISPQQQKEQNFSGPSVIERLLNLEEHLRLSHPKILHESYFTEPIDMSRTVNNRTSSSADSHRDHDDDDDDGHHQQQTEQPVPFHLDQFKVISSNMD